MSTEKTPPRSTAYHKYYEGYAERTFYDEEGKRRFDRIYVGKYYRRALPDGQHYLVKALYLAVYLISVAAYLYASTRYTAGNDAVYCMVSIGLSLLALIWLAIPVTFSVTAGREMLIRTYRDATESLLRASLVAAVLQAANFVTAVIGEILSTYHADAVFFRSIGGYFLSSILLFGLFLMEKRMKYDELPARNTAPPDYTLIKLRNTF